MIAIIREKSIILDKIESYGFCTSSCTDERTGFMYVNLNILTDEECEKLFKYQELEWMNWNKDYEICTGRKHKFPAQAQSLIRKKKGKKQFKREEEKAKKC